MSRASRWPRFPRRNRPWLKVRPVSPPRSRQPWRVVHDRADRYRARGRYGVLLYSKTRVTPSSRRTRFRARLACVWGLPFGFDRSSSLARAASRLRAPLGCTDRTGMASPRACCGGVRLGGGLGRARTQDVRCRARGRARSPAGESLAYGCVNPGVGSRRLACGRGRREHQLPWL
jgi:hypothetical protein